MANIGELFKFLGKDETFTKYCNEIKNGKTNDEIINIVFDDNDFVSRIKDIVQDETIIKDKMKTIIGQKRKVLETNKNKDENKVEKKEKTEENSESNTQHLEQDEEEFDFKFKPINDFKAVWLSKYSFIEQIDHRMRLTNYDMEIYY